MINIFTIKMFFLYICSENVVQYIVEFLLSKFFFLLSTSRIISIKINKDIKPIFRYYQPRTHRKFELGFSLSPFLLGTNALSTVHVFHFREAISIVCIPFSQSRSRSYSFIFCIYNCREGLAKEGVA